MKRALTLLGAIGVTVLITYLAVTRQQAQQRASQLDRALQDAEARVLQLEADIEAAKQRLAELNQARQVARPPASPARTGPQAKGASAPATAQTDIASAPEPAATLAPPAPLPPAPGGIVTPPPLAGPLIRYAARSGPTNLVRIEGTSNIHDWQVEGHLVGGSAEFGSGFPTGPGAQELPDTVQARVNVFIPVRSLKSVEKNGRPYSDAMDEIMYGKLLESANKRITYTLNSLTLKEQPRAPADPFQYEAAGNLCVAGVTNLITMPVAVLLDPMGRIQFAGDVKVKMTDFKITPPAPLVGKVIKTEDEVTLRFVWCVQRIGSGQTAR